ncbi:MAG TPA: PDGLE domain-containing protein [Acidimicrobiales bacterium]
MRRRLGLFVAAGLLVALALAFFVGPGASSSPDGLERVALDEGFADEADDHRLADSPLADYGVEGVDDERLGTGLAGVVGVGVTFVVMAGLVLGLRAAARRRRSPAEPGPDTDTADAATNATAPAPDAQPEPQRGTG